MRGKRAKLLRKIARGLGKDWPAVAYVDKHVTAERLVMGEDGKPTLGLVARFITHVDNRSQRGIYLQLKERWKRGVL